MDKLELANKLYRIFFEIPVAKAMLVFEDNQYLGVVFKKDIEIGIKKKYFDFNENINIVNNIEIEWLVFDINNKKNIRIPVLNKNAELIKILSYEEYLSIFNFDSFIEKFNPPIYLDNLSNPLIITNFFKKIIWTNKKGFELAKKDIVGKNINYFLKMFDFIPFNNLIIAEKDNIKYNFIISTSDTPVFFYQFYLFTEI